jgi:signal transduction histidine kinase
MSSSQPGLHGDALLEALTAAAIEVQRARTVGGVLEAAGRGLERAGLLTAILSVNDGGAWVRYLSPQEPLPAFAKLGTTPEGRVRSLSPEGEVQRAVVHEQPELIDGLRDKLAAAVGPGARPELLSRVPDRAAVAPLHVRREPWGALIAIGDQLRASDLPSLRLFSLQLGSALEVSEAFERLERRNAELDLVHELAIAGPGADSRALCRRALETVCRTTQSDAGTLHRFDADAQEFVLVGDAWGYDGALIEEYRRFALAPTHPVASGPVAVRVEALLFGSEAMRAEGFAQVALVPLGIQGRPVGLLTLARRRDVAFRPSEVRSAEILGVQMASLLERARLYDESSRLYADLKTSYDRLERAQQELVRHERLAALGELAAVMAHEVRNPLGVIFNSLTTLRRLTQPVGDAEMLLNIVGEEADRLNRIVGDLLDFVRPYELVKRPVAVEPIVTGAVDAAAQAALNANIRVVTQFPQPLPPFPLDAHLLKQALVNLVVNATQAMPRGGTVSVLAALESVAGQPWLTISVRDEGVGLTPRAAEKMFQPFFTTKATGTGLGLAVVKRIIDAHLGEIIARPNDDGPGTTFVVRLPATVESRAGLGTPPRPSPAVRPAQRPTGSTRTQ